MSQPGKQPPSGEANDAEKDAAEGAQHEHPMPSVAESHENQQEASGRDCPNARSGQRSGAGDDEGIFQRSSDKPLFKNKAPAAGRLFQKQSTNQSLFGNASYAPLFKGQVGVKPKFGVKPPFADKASASEGSRFPKKSSDKPQFVPSPFQNKAISKFAGNSGRFQSRPLATGGGHFRHPTFGLHPSTPTNVRQKPSVPPQDSLWDAKPPTDVVARTHTDVEDHFTSQGNLSVPLISVTVPKGVTSIDANAFAKSERLVSVAIPKGVSTIGLGAFQKCTSLNSVAIPEGLSTIGESAFSGCCGLTSVTIPAGVTTIGKRAFYGCSGLTSATIPESVTTIGASAFNGCSGLTSVTIPGGVTTIGDHAFADCCGLTSVTIPAGVTTIGRGAFAECSKLTSVAIPDGITAIAKATFFGCQRLASVAIPEGVTTIGESAFGRCYDLLSVTIPEGVTTIGDYAFSGCRGLISVTIPEGVTTIGKCAFNGCRGLSSVNIPEGVTFMGLEAFKGCVGLISISIPNSVKRISFGVFNSCPSLSFVIAPVWLHGGYEKYFPDSPLVTRLETDTAKNRLHALRQQYWSLSTHKLCSALQQEWVVALLLIISRLSSKTSRLPLLPLEMWMAVMEFIPRRGLGVHLGRSVTQLSHRCF